MQESTIDLPQLTSVPLQYGQRLFPKTYSDRLNGQSMAISKLDQKAARTDSREVLENEIWKLLPLSNHEPQEKDGVIETYINSLGVLNQLRNDVDRFLDDICLANLEFRQESGTTDEQQMKKSMEKKHAEMREKSTLAISPPKNQIDAARATLPIELMVPELKNALRDSVTEFVNEFYNGLRTLVDQQFFGLIEWPGDNVCRYHFFREVLIQHQIAEQESDIVRFDDDFWIRETTTNTSGHNVHRIGRHEHHVINAYVTSPSNTRVIMPVAVSQLVANIPDWLRPVVSIVDGTLVREIIVEQDVSEENWEESRTREEVIPQDDPIYGCEPAVIIDEFVLTGWGPTEIEIELARREQQRMQEQARTRVRFAARNRYLYFAAAILTQVISIFVLYLSEQSPLGLLFALVAFSLGAPLWLFSIRSHLEVTGATAAALQPGLRVAAWTMVSASLPLLVMGIRSSWLGLFSSIFLLLLGLSLSGIRLTVSQSGDAEKGEN